MPVVVRAVLPRVAVVEDLLPMAVLVGVRMGVPVLMAVGVHVLVRVLADAGVFVLVLMLVAVGVGVLVAVFVVSFHGSPPYAHTYAVAGKCKA